MAQVFGCPECQQKFQVPDDATGQSFQCPACQAAVEIPADGFQGGKDGDETPPKIFGCPHCNGQFGITDEMIGKELACPHCEELVAVGVAPSEPKLLPPQIQNDQQSAVSDIVIDSETDRKQKPVVPAKAVDQDRPVASSPEELQSSSVAHLLPPKFDVPDPVRFPSSLQSGRVLLPDGSGGFQSADALTVTITHNGEVYHLKKLNPQQRRRRKMIHSSVAIGIAILLIYLTLQTLGLNLF